MAEPVLLLGFLAPDPEEVVLGRHLSSGTHPLGSVFQ